MQDIETAAYLSDLPERFRFVPVLASHVIAMLSDYLLGFKNECNRYGGTIRILEVDRRTELSLDEFFGKYYEGVGEIQESKGI